MPNKEDTLDSTTIESMTIADLEQRMLTIEVPPKKATIITTPSPDEACYIQIGSTELEPDNKIMILEHPDNPDKWVVMHKTQGPQTKPLVRNTDQTIQGVLFKRTADDMLVAYSSSKELHYAGVDAEIARSWVIKTNKELKKSDNQQAEQGATTTTAVQESAKGVSRAQRPKAVSLYEKKPSALQTFLDTVKATYELDVEPKPPELYKAIIERRELRKKAKERAINKEAARKSFEQFAKDLLSTQDLDRKKRGDALDSIFFTVHNDDIQKVVESIMVAGHPLETADKPTYKKVYKRIQKLTHDDLVKGLPLSEETKEKRQLVSKAMSNIKDKRTGKK